MLLQADDYKIIGIGVNIHSTNTIWHQKGEVDDNDYPYWLWSEANEVAPGHISSVSEATRMAMLWSSAVLFNLILCSSICLIDILGKFLVFHWRNFFDSTMFNCVTCQMITSKIVEINKEVDK